MHTTDPPPPKQKFTLRYGPLAANETPPNPPFLPRFQATDHGRGVGRSKKAGGISRGPTWMVMIGGGDASGLPAAQH